MGSRPRVAASGAVGAVFGATTSSVNGLSSAYTPIGVPISTTVLSAPLQVASVVLDAGWSWAALAVVVGYAVARRGAAAVAGAAALGGATVAYVLGDAVLLDVPVGELWGEARLWLVASLLLGPPLALVGVLARDERLPGLLARLVVPAGALAQLVLLGWSPDPSTARPADVWAFWFVAVGACVLTGTFVAQHVRHRLGRSPVGGAALS